MDNLSAYDKYNNKNLNYQVALAAWCIIMSEFFNLLVMINGNE